MIRPAAARGGVEGVFVLYDATNRDTDATNRRVPRQRAATWKEFQSEVLERSGSKEANVVGLFEAMDVDGAKNTLHDVSTMSSWVLRKQGVTAPPPPPRRAPPLLTPNWHRIRGGPEVVSQTRGSREGHVGPVGATEGLSFASLRGGRVSRAALLSPLSVAARRCAHFSKNVARDALLIGVCVHVLVSFRRMSGLSADSGMVSLTELRKGLRKVRFHVCAEEGAATARRARGHEGEQAIVR